MTIFFGEKFPFSRPKFLMTFSLVIDQVFPNFPFFSQIFRIFIGLLCSMSCKTPLLTRKTTISENEFLYDIIFLTLFVLSHASDNTTSQNIGGTVHGGTDAWAVPHLKFLGGPSPRSPRSPPMVPAPQTSGNYIHH